MSASSGIRYPLSLVTRARELREGGWSLRAIADLVERETGHRPAHNSVFRWTDEAGRLRNNARTVANSRQRRHENSTGRLGGARPSDAFKILRARKLRERGMTMPAVAIVMNFDYGGDYNAEQWAGALETGRFPRRYKPRRRRTVAA